MFAAIVEVKAIVVKNIQTEKPIDRSEIKHKVDHITFWE